MNEYCIGVRGGQQRAKPEKRASRPQVQFPGPELQLLGEVALNRDQAAFWDRRGGLVTQSHRVLIPDLALRPNGAPAGQTAGCNRVRGDVRDLDTCSVLLKRANSPEIAISTRSNVHGPLSATASNSAKYKLQLFFNKPNRVWFINYL